MRLTQRIRREIGYVITARKGKFLTLETGDIIYMDKVDATARNHVGGDYLIRYAESNTDYTVGHNYFCDVDDIRETVKRVIARQGK